MGREIMRSSFTALPAAMARNTPSPTNPSVTASIRNWLSIDVCPPTAGNVVMPQPKALCCITRGA